MSETTHGAPRLTREEIDASLREEVEQLGRIADEQEATIAALRREVALHTLAIGWRLQLRLDPVRAWCERIPVLRQIYRVLYRALEVWVDEGFLKIFVRTGDKIGLALRGRDFLVEDRGGPLRSIGEQYEAWMRRFGRSPDRRAMQDAVARLARTPLVSVLTLVDSADIARLNRVVATLQAQAYERWELCAAVGPEVRKALHRELDAALGGEPRLRIGGSDGDTPAWADAFRVAGGDFIGLLGGDDELAPEALVELVARLDREPDADIVYSDEDVVTTEGRREEPFMKPDWSPDLLLSTNYMERFGLVRKRLVDEVGGFAADAGCAQSYDLMLRLCEKTDRIAHVAKVLYHRRRLPTTVDAVLERHAANRDECRALVRAVRRRGGSGHVTPVYARTGGRCYTTRFDLRERPLVSIVIPTRNKRRLLQTTIEGLSTRTDYDRHEIIIVDNGSTDPDALEYLTSLRARCQVLAWNEPFNYSALNNFGARHARGQQLLFLNNDVEVIRADWLSAMVEHAERPEVGAVGAKLLYPDGRIQHAGIVVGINRVAANAFRTWPGRTIGSPRLADLTRNCSAVTGACMMVPRRVFDQVGGFDTGLRVVLNDVDLCLRIRQHGYLVVYTPEAQLYHHEGSSRGRLHPPEDDRAFGARWTDFIDRGDPYYSPNLTDRHDDWRLRVGTDED